MSNPTIRFAAIGLNHGHIYGQTSILLNAGAELVSVYSEEADLLAEYTARFPQAKAARSKQEILDDESIQLIISAAIPCDRAPLGIEVMRHGKDYMSDKPGFTSLDQLEQVRQVAAETGRIYSIDYSERFENQSTVKAGELVRAGAIGQVIQTIGLGPHLRRFHTRPEWFFEEEKYGGILCDIGSHQFDQYLYFTGATEAEIVASQVANYHHPQYPGLQDFGDVVVRSPGCSGYIRVDWFTPDGLPTWGDTRLTVIGTEGYIEVRKNCDIAGRPGGNHLFLVNGQEVQYVDCSDVPLTYGRLLIDDVLNRTETAMTQEHCLLASQLALQAQAQATRLGHLR
ncbi:MAG: Gfo/Idh/MocA family oxidoreductase [Caldilineaceae bacterium]|nr:Gfo/Idh/MocA family oxidoreductase [Caldilineaceae bacterium]MCB9156883.1 Gfo/Idh/MocA family oxidoreductase [Caldilineaceae bacterium]